MRLSRFFYVTLFYALLMAHLAAGIYFNGYRWDWLFWVTLAYVLVIVGGSLMIRWNLFFDSVNRLPLTVTQMRQPHKRVMLTFNGGPGLHTLEVLGILKEKSVKALFFVNGIEVKAHPGFLKSIQEEGHGIGNGTFFHVRNFPFKPVSKMVAEIEEAGEVIASVTGHTPVYFRPPFGVCNPAVAAAIRKTGVKSVGWNVNSRDLRMEDAGQISRQILKQVRPDAIILLHERSVATIEALPELIDTLLGQGYRFEVLES